MKLKLLPVLICLGILFQSQALMAQKTEPGFEIKTGDVVSIPKFMIQASTGELITGNDFKLMGIDADKKTVVWENKDFSGLEEADLTVIDGTPFIKIERQNKLSIAKNRNTFILQATNGEVVYDSKDEGIKVRSTIFIPQLGGLLMKVVKDGFLSASFIDAKTTKEVWKVQLGKEKADEMAIFSLARLFNLQMGKHRRTPIVDAAGTLVLVYKKKIYAVAKSGTVLWKKSYDENINGAYLSTDRKSLFIGYNKFIDKLNTAHGNSELKEPIKMRDELNGITPMGNDYIVYNRAGINIMDAAGNMKWKKDAWLSNIAEVRYTSTGILGIQSALDDETALFWLDNTGNKVWVQQITGGFMLAEPTANGVMYVTTQRANTLTYEKGKDVWNRDIKLKGIPNFGADTANKILYAYAGETLHAFNFYDNTYKLVADDLPLQKFNEEEEQLTFDFRNNGSTIVISSKQNVVSIQAADGKINYNNYFKDIGNIKKQLKKDLAVSGQLYGAAIATKAAADITRGIAKGFVGEEGAVSQFDNGFNSLSTGTQINVAATQLFGVAAKRYLASQATKENLYILSQMPEGNGLLVWNKEKGVSTKKIYFGDTTPVFVVDEATDRIYVMVGNVLKAYDLK